MTDAEWADAMDLALGDQDKKLHAAHANGRIEERAAIIAELERIAGIHRNGGDEALARFAESLAKHFSENQHTRKG